MTALFDASSIERDYAFLDACPEALVGDVVTLPVGTLQERVAGLLGWRDALLAGRLPAEGSWPSAPVDAPIRAALQEMDLARLAQVASGFSQLPIQDDIPDLDDSAEALAARPPRKNVVSKRIGV